MFFGGCAADTRAEETEADDSDLSKAGPPLLAALRGEWSDFGVLEDSGGRYKQLVMGLEIRSGSSFSATLVEGDREVE